MAYPAPKACGVSTRTPPQSTSRGRQREKESLQADGRRQKTPQQTEGCALETRGGLLLETPFGVYAMEPVVATIHGVHADRYSRKRRRVAEEDTNARQWVPEPEKRLSAEAKAFRNPPQATATPQVARSEEWNI
ncbi:MAG: hypothetical protein ACO2PN_27120 [Pyrobaculum sp.]|jgi:hypothetical protein